MASRPWSSRELAVLELHVGERDWLGAVQTKITDRTKLALKVRMAKLRGSLGLGDGRTVAGDGGAGDNDEWMSDASAASQVLLEATLRVGVWS